MLGQPGNPEFTDDKFHVKELGSRLPFDTESLKGIYIEIHVYYIYIDQTVCVDLTFGCGKKWFSTSILVPVPCQVIRSTDMLSQFRAVITVGFLVTRHLGLSEKRVPKIIQDPLVDHDFPH